jgi:hypothetical protein
MSKRKLTPWFPAQTPPARIGLYERRVVAGTERRFSYWNGKFWGLSLESKETAVEYRNSISAMNTDWRGYLADQEPEVLKEAERAMV